VVKFYIIQQYKVPVQDLNGQSSFFIIVYITYQLLLVHSDVTDSNTQAQNLQKIIVFEEIKLLF
jgi:hypothetical protein